MSDQTQTPEASAIPSTPATPATPATPTTPTSIVSALFAFLGQYATNPIEQMALSYAQTFANQYQTQLATLLGTSGPLTVKGVVDAVFSFVESKAQRPFVKYVLKGLNVLIDDVGLPALQVFLATKGIVLPLS